MARLLPWTLALLAYGSLPGYAAADACAGDEGSSACKGGELASSPSTTAAAVTETAGTEAQRAAPVDTCVAGCTSANGETSCILRSEWARTIAIVCDEGGCETHAPREELPEPIPPSGLCTADSREECGQAPAGPTEGTAARDAGLPSPALALPARRLRASVATPRPSRHGQPRPGHRIPVHRPPR